MSGVMAKSVFIVLLFWNVHVQALVNSSSYVGCFKHDFENGFDFTPGDYESSHVTPLTCAYLCSPRYKYTAIRRESACFCGNTVNVTLKVNDSYCNTSCGGTLHHGVYEITQGIVGLILEVPKEIPLLTSTWCNASVLEGIEIEFRFQIDNEIVSPFSKSSVVPCVFRELGEHLVSVAARNRLSDIVSVAKIVNVIDINKNVEIQCPAVAVPGEEILCKGEWGREARSFQFHFGDGSSENVLYDAPLDRVGTAINQSQEVSKETNHTLGTFLLVSEVFPGRGRISHWELLASKPGKIKVQVFRPYYNTQNHSCQNRSYSPGVRHFYDSIMCSQGKSLCLTRKQCVPSGQLASYSCLSELYNTTSLQSDYELLAEETLAIPSAGYHVFSITRSQQFTVGRLDIIGWSSEGGQLSSIDNQPQRNPIFEYPLIAKPGAMLLCNSFSRMHFTSHALSAYVRPPMNFELRHNYSHPGVYKIYSPFTQTMSININNPMAAFEIIVQRLSSTNTTTLLRTGDHNGTGVTYHWDFGDGYNTSSPNSTITHIYYHPGRFTVKLFATNVVSNHSLSADVEVLDPIKSCHFKQPIRVVVPGKDSFIKWQCLSGSNISFTAHLGDGSMKIIKTGWDEVIGGELSHMYASTGNFSVTILVSSPIGPNISFTSQALVEVPITDLQLRLLSPTYSPTLYIVTATGITLERSLRGTHAICEYDFGDTSAPLVSSRSRVKHTYHNPGTYHVNVTCYNHVSSVWSVLNSTIIVETAVQLKNITLSVVPAVLGNPSVFNLRINRGNLFSCRWNFGDGGTWSAAFSMTTQNMNHSYTEPGTYTVNVTCRNVIGDSWVAASAEVDEPIRDATIVHEYRYVRVNQTIEIRLTCSGSRVQYCINCEGNSWDARRVITKNITMVTIKHVYTTPGVYPVIVRLWNSVSSRNVSERSIIVQNPVKGLQLFAITPSRCPSLSIAIRLNLSADFPPPTNASAFFDFGDGSRKYFTNLSFHHNIFFEEHSYLHPGLYNVTVNVTNQLSSQYFTDSVNLASSSLEGISTVYHDGSGFQQGLGSSNQYFPTERTVRFELQKDRDDVSFEWKIGNKSLGETKNGTIQHVFVSPGCFNISAVIKTRTLREHCLSSICIEEEIKDIEFDVNHPTYFKYPTVFTFSIEYFRSCFVLDLGDNTTVKFGHTTCGFAYQNLATYQHLYKTPGKYVVTLLGWNHVSSKQRSHNVTILDEVCPSPKIHIAGGGPKDRPLIVRSSEEIVLEAIVHEICQVAKTMILKWDVFVVNRGVPGHQVLHSARREVAIFENTTESLRNEHLSMLVRHLPTELLMVELGVSFIGTDRDLYHVNVTDNTWLLVSRSPLVARIKGGHSRSVPWKSFFVLDGRKSYDPENIFDSTSLTFSWSCRPLNTSISWKSKVAFDVPSGCFKNSSFILLNSSIMELSTEDLFSYQGYVFALEVKEGTRKSVFEQSVFVIAGTVPSMDLSCILNCKEMAVNPTQRLAIESKCLNCETTTRLIYKWSIFICSSLNNTGASTCKEMPNVGQNTSTGLHTANLAILPNVLYIGMTYKVRCNARISGVYHSGFVEYLLKVNSPPSGGECVVTPGEGYVLETRFNIRCAGWYDQDRPLSYLIETKIGTDTVYLTSGSHPNMTLVLPSGTKENNFTIQVIAKVVDTMHFSSSSFHSVKVFPPRSINYRKVVNDVREAIDRRENKLVFGIVISLCSLLNNNFNVSEQNYTDPKEIRLNIAQILGQMNVSGFDEMRAMSDSFQVLSAKSDEVSFETQRAITRALQNKMSVLHRLSDTSRDIVDIGTTFHKVVSNLVEAALLMSAVNITMVTVENTTSTNETTRTSYKDDMKQNRSESIDEALLTLDKINSVLLSQVVADDQPTVIQTKHFDVQLSRQSLHDLTKDTSKDLQVKLENITSLVEKTNLTAQSVLGLMVTDVSKTQDIYGVSTDEVNSNVLRLLLNNDVGLPVDLSMVDTGVFVDRKSNDLLEKTFEINTLSSERTMKIHTFNRSIEDTALVLQIRQVDTEVKLRALLSVGQRPTLENYEFQAHFPSTNMTSGGSLYTWVLSHDLLRNISSPDSRRYFLGVTMSEKDVGVKINYTLRVFWTKCLMLDEGIWTSDGCKVGPLTTYHRTHCICRPGEPTTSSEIIAHSSSASDVAKSRLRRAVDTTSFTRKGIFKISIGAGMFSAPNKIDFQLVFDANLNDNPLALIAVSTVFGIFLILLIYARGQDKKDSEKVGAAALQDNDPCDKYFFEVSVHTGYVFGAGTTANVSIVLCGQKSELHARALCHSNRQCFQRGGIDTFLVSSANSIGDIECIQVWHDNSGSSPEWFLDRVIVRNLNEKKSYLFLNDTWLAVEKGLETVKAILFPVSKEDMIGFKRLFKTTTQRNLKDCHLWFSVFTRPVNSRFTRVQRLSCCLTLCYCTMLANAMFYQDGGSNSVESSIIIGPFRFGVNEIWIGLMSALVILPINAIIVWIFRNVEVKPCKEDIKAMKESSKIWWLRDFFFCCFKSDVSHTGLMKIINSNDNGVSAIDLRIGDDNVPSSPSSCDLVEDIEMEVELADKRISLMKNFRKTSFVLPYWYIYLAWFALCLTSITCAFFVVLYGLQFGKDVTARWISSMTITFFQDVLISEPLKVFAIAAVVAILVKKPENLENEEQREIKSKDYYKWDFIQKESENESSSSPKKHLKPLDQKELDKARAKRLKEVRTWSLLKELGLYVLFLFCLSAVTYRNKNPMSYEINKIMKDLFITAPAGNGKSFEQISDVNDVFTWANNTLLKGLYSSSSWYNHQLSPESAATKADLYVIGQVRIRQTRVKQNSCSVPRYFRETIKECHGWSSGDDRDTSCYGINWTPITNATQCSPTSSLDPWKFHSSSKKTTTYSIMTSNDGGFIVHLKRSNRTKNSRTMAFLKSHKWLDARTREIFIEVNIYSAPYNLFCLGRLTIKLLPTNGMTKEARFLVTKLFALNGVLDTPSVVSHVFVFLFSLIFMYRETKRLYRLKKKYLTDFWNLLQSLIVFVILACIVVFFLRLAMVEHLLTSFENNEDLSVTFEHVAFIDMVLGQLIAFVVFFSWIRVLKLLRFNKRLLFLQETLKKTAKPLAAFSVIFLTLFFAYAHFGYLIFTRDLYRFRNIPTTFITLCSLFMGHFDFSALEETNRILGPVFLFSSMFFGVFIIMNLLIALILESFLIVKADATNRENEYELVDFVTKHLRAWLGFAGIRSPAAKSPGQQPPRCMKTGEISKDSSNILSKKAGRRDGSVSVNEKLNNSKRCDVLETAEKQVRYLEYVFESFSLDDISEDIFNYKLLFNGVTHCLNEGKDKVFQQEKYETTEEYTLQGMKTDGNEKIVQKDDPCISKAVFQLTDEDHDF